MGIKTVNAFILIVYCYNSTSSGNIDVLAPIETCFPILTKKLHIKHTGSKHCAFRSFCPDYIELTWPTPNCQPWGHSECHKTTKHCLDHLSISACTDNFQNLLLKLPSLQVSTLLRLWQASNWVQSNLSNYQIPYLSGLFGSPQSADLILIKVFLQSCWLISGTMRSPQLFDSQLLSIKTSK